MNMFVDELITKCRIKNEEEAHV